MMRISDLLVMAFKNLWRRKSRTLLTIFGVLIGSVSVVLMLSIALGAERQSMKMIQQFGNIRVITVNVNHTFTPPDINKSTKKKKDDKPKLNDETVKTLQGLANVEEVMPVYNGSFTFFKGREENGTSVMACDMSKLEKFGIELKSGRLPKSGEHAIVVGNWFSRNFYDPKARNNVDRWDEFDPSKAPDLVGETYRTYYEYNLDSKGNKKRHKVFEVVGMSKDETEYAYNVVVDIDAFKEMKLNDIKRYGDYKAFRKNKDAMNYDEIKVLVKDVDSVLAVSEEIKNLGFQARNEMEFVNQLKKQSGVLTLVLGGIGAVALFVAAIGITNTMVMSIYERTREIGVMKVLGCEVYDILKLFLLEAAIIGFLGGLVGIGLSYIGSDVINNATQNSGMLGIVEGGSSGISYIPIWLSLLSLVFSTMIGVVAGILPAIRATRLSALEAIKNE